MTVNFNPQLMSWLQLHPPSEESVTWDELNSTPQSFDDFMRQYDILREKANTIKKGIKAILESKE